MMYEPSVRCFCAKCRRELDSKMIFEKDNHQSKRTEIAMTAVSCKCEKLDKPETPDIDAGIDALAMALKQLIKVSRETGA